MVSAFTPIRIAATFAGMIPLGESSALHPFHLAAARLGQLGPVVIGVFFLSGGVFFALCLLLGATAWRKTGPRLVAAWRRAVTRGASGHATQLIANEPLSPLSASTLLGIHTAPEPEETAWRPLSEEIAGVGHVEWDAATLRTFAGQPEVLARLAFHRWRYQQGMLFECDQLEYGQVRRSAYQDGPGMEALRPLRPLPLPAASSAENSRNTSSSQQSAAGSKE